MAVKIIKNKEAYRNQAILENKILKLLNKYESDEPRCIVKLLSDFECKNHICFVFELLDYSLYDLLTQNQYQLSIQLLEFH